MLHFRWYTPAFYGLLAIIVLQYHGVDTGLAGTIFKFTQGWELRDNWWLNSVVHHGGRKLVVFVVVSMMLFTALSFFRHWFNAPQRNALLFATLATFLNILIIAALKQFTTLPCPWDVQGLGGDLPYLYLHQVFDSHLIGQQCFPAGHASGGYALFSLYFAALLWRTESKNTFRSQKRWLLPGFILGGIFGIAQQLRGAHFLSHDIATALICWYCSGLLFFVFYQFRLIYKYPRHHYAFKILYIRKEATTKTNSLNFQEKSQ